MTWRSHTLYYRTNGDQQEKNQCLDRSKEAKHWKHTEAMPWVFSTQEASAFWRLWPGQCSSHPALPRGDHLQSQVRLSTAEVSEPPGWRNLSKKPLPALNTPLWGVFIVAIMMWYSEGAKRPVLTLELQGSQAIKPYFTTISTGSSL